MKKLAILTLLITCSTPAFANHYVYSCKAKGKTSLVKIDDVANTLQWRGKTYTLKDQPECTKFGWRAEGNGDAGDFCTATQGVADFDMAGLVMDCDLKH